MNPRPFIFPDLEGAPWGYVNFNAQAKRDFPPPAKNPLLDAAFSEVWKDNIRREMGVDFLYGGYLEDRSDLWRGHYHTPGHMRHLGIDLYVPVGTRVIAPCFGVVTLSRPDPDQHGGWGGMLHIHMDWPHQGASHLILGHLAHQGLPALGQRVTPGQVVGLLGESSENGGWSPHLHVQLYNDDVAQAYAGRLHEIDGYGPNDQTVRPDMPDPTSLIMRPCKR